MRNKESQFNVRDMVNVSLCTAVLCICAPYSINIGPVPFSFTTLIIYLTALSLGLSNSMRCIVLYIILGAIGLPVFSGFQGGFHKVAGLTGGFIIGYIPLTYASSVFSVITENKRIYELIGMIAGTVLLYTCGTAWFIVQSGARIDTAFKLCVAPFLIGDSFKITVAYSLAPKLRAIIRRY